MKKLVLIVGLCLFWTVETYAYDNHDFQVWHIDAAEWKVNKASKITYEQEFRWGNNASDFYYQHYDVGYLYLLNKYFNFGGGFRYVLDKSGDKFRADTEPYFAAIMFWSPAGFNLSNRIRIEYHYFDYRSVYWRFRNKLDIKFPWKFTKFEIQPMVADEIFFKFNGIDLNENRMYAGLAFTLTRNLKGEITYLLRSTKNTGTCTWTDTNVLNTKLKFVF